MEGRLDRLGARKQTAVDGVHDRLGSDRSATEETAIQAFDSVFAALNAVELQIDVALRARI